MFKRFNRLIPVLRRGEHPAQAGGAVAVKTRDVAVPVVGDVLLGFQQALACGTAAVVRRIGQALQGVVAVAVGVRHHRSRRIRRGEGNLGDAPVVPCRGPSLLRGGVAQRFAEHEVGPPVVTCSDARGPAVDVVVEGGIAYMVRPVAHDLLREAAEFVVFAGQRTERHAVQLPVAAGDASAVVVVVPLRASDAAVRRRRAVGVRRRVKDLALEHSLEHTQRNTTLHGREKVARMRKGQNMMSEKQTSFEPLDPKLKPLLRICGLLNI